MRVAAATLAIFVALPEEAAPLKNVLGDVLTVTGPGPVRAARMAAQVLDASRPAGVICAGLAGGLRPVLERGHLLAAHTVLDHATDETFAADPALLEAARRCAPRPQAGSEATSGFREGVLLTHDRVVGTASGKAALSHRADAVDMESAAVARAAAQRGIPFLALRVISDTAEEDFPFDLNDYIDGQGNVRRMKLAAAAIVRPRTVPFLLKMRASAQDGSATLATCLIAVMNHLRRPE